MGHGIRNKGHWSHVSRIYHLRARLMSSFIFTDREYRSRLISQYRSIYSRPVRLVIIDGRFASGDKGE